MQLRTRRRGALVVPAAASLVRGSQVHPSSPAPVPTLRYDAPVAVIGDIHGRLDLLDLLLTRLPDAIPLITVGDHCDRGPSSYGVVERLVSRKARGVLGNHDLWLQAWANGGALDGFALSPVMGGEATLASYGASGACGGDTSGRERVPPAHREWLNSLPPALELVVMRARYVVAHAGIPEGTFPVGLTAPATAAWLAKFKPHLLHWAGAGPEHCARLGDTIVMGHMRRFMPVDLGHVIGVDTGCGFPGGALSAVLLPERRFVVVGM